MRHVYAPFIGRVIAEAQARQRGTEGTDVSEAVRAARESMKRTRAVHDDLAPAVLRAHEGVERALHDVGVCFDLVESALRQVEEAATHPQPPPVEGDRPVIAEPLLAAGVEALEGALSELWRALDVLASLQAAEEIGSPFPTINLCVKVGMNVLDGHLPPSDLDRWVTEVERMLGAMQSRIARFETLHADAPAPLRSAAASLLIDLQAGAGALRVYRVSGERPPLLDGLRLLRHASERLAAVLEEMDRYVRQTARWSRMPAVEAFCRAFSQQAPAAVRDDCAASVAHLLAFIDAQRRALRALPLAYTISDRIDALEVALGAARVAFASVRDGSADTEALCAFQDAIAEVRNQRDACQAALEREMDGAALSPRLEELKELAGRYLQGAVSEALLRERVIVWLKAHALLEMQIRDAARNALGSDAADLLALLHQQGAGIEEATRFFRDGDATHLVEGFRQMEAPLAGLAEIQERVVRALQPARPDPTPIACFRCASPNPPGRTHCRSCGVLLPAISRAFSPAPEDSETPVPLPRTIARLQRVVDAYEQHKASAADIQYEAGLFLGRLGHIRRDFERRFVPRLRAERSPSLINMGRDFYETLTDLQLGLYDMLAFGDHGRPDGLYRGLQSAISAGRAMQASQARIEEVLGSL